MECVKLMCLVVSVFATEDAAHAERSEPVLHSMYQIKQGQGLQRLLTLSPLVS